MSLLRSLIGTFLNTDTPPDRVLEVRSDKYHNRNVICREDSIVLYDRDREDNRYELVMLKPMTESMYHAYSLFRSESRTEAELRFSHLKDKLPLLCNITSPPLNMVQEYCNVIRDHISWTVCHLAVHFNIVNGFDSGGIRSQINNSDLITGISPLQLAVKNNNLAIVNKLLQIGANVNHVDFQGNSIHHLAACTTKEIINALVKHTSQGSLNQRNNEGQTPLHMACISDKPECVKALLIAGADVNLSATGMSKSSSSNVGDFVSNHHAKLQNEDMKFGGTPLHWASSKEVIEALVERNCDINALNFNSRTALHIMVLRSRLECAVALLAKEANPDIQDSEGNTPLHLAVKLDNVTLAQALLVFGADLSIRNNNKATPRHLIGSDYSTSELEGRILYTLHSVGAPRCPQSMTGCGIGCSSQGTYNGIPPPPPASPSVREIQNIFTADILMSETAGRSAKKCRQGGRILSLDGGGIRGLVLVMLLLHLEQAVGRPIVHCFDWLAATSTGAIIALALSCGKSLRECLCLYFSMKDRAFSGFRPYSSEPLEDMLKETFGSDTKMAEISHPKVMIVGCLADRKPVELHFFRNYKSPDEMLGNVELKGPLGLPPTLSPCEQPIWQAARASGAAPSYFRAFGRFVDGGLISNNPTLDALTEVHEYNTALRLLNRGDEVVQPSLVVSIGTGSVPVTPVDSMDIFWPSGFWDTAKLVSGVKSMQAVLVDQATLADGRVIDRARALCSMLDIPYFRFSPQMSEDVALDEKSDAKLINLLWETKAYICNQDEQVTKLALLLNT